MPDYGQDHRWRVLGPVLDEHAEWFHAVLHHAFYPDQGAYKRDVQKPVTFAEWIIRVGRDPSLQAELVGPLGKLHEDLLAASDSLMASAHEKGKPALEAFQKFMLLYEEFGHRLRRLEKDVVTENSGYDVATGLRSKSLMFKDVEREMHRLSRRGRSFCLAMVRLNRLNEIRQNYSSDEVAAYLKLVADLIKISIRSFDDAYYLGGDEFLLCLKQAEISGGVAGLERLRKELEHQQIMLVLNGEKVPMSMSCCIAEPVAGDDVQEMIKYLRTDLQNLHEKSDAVLEFHEMSPLQRFVQKGL